MVDEMVHATVSIASLAAPNYRRTLENVPVDTGGEYNWIPASVLQELGIVPMRIDRFETADGRVLEREIGFAMLYASDRSTPTIVVFAGVGDPMLLGAFGLEGLNLRIDLGRKELVHAGPVSAAPAA